MNKPFSWSFEKGTWVSRKLLYKKPIKVEAWICSGEMRHHSILWVNWVCFWCVAWDISAGFLLCQQSHTQQSLHFDSVWDFRVLKSCVCMYDQDSRIVSFEGLCEARYNTEPAWWQIWYKICYKMIVLVGWNGDQYILTYWGCFIIINISF